MADAKKEHEEEHGEEAAAGGGKKKLIIIIVAVVLVLIIGGVVAMMMMSKGGAEEENATGADAHGAKDSKAGKKDEKKKAAHGEEAKAGPMLAVDNLVVNLVTETGSRYAKISLALEGSDLHALPEMAERKAIIQDIIISVLSQKTADELISFKGKENAKGEILDKVNAKIGDGKVVNVYYTAFIVQ
jgi:flagellar protein FliL